jgi:hypothetical protein
MCKETADFEKMFNIQLKRLQTHYVDYYLIHMLSNRESWERVRMYGIEQWIESKKKEGSIKNIGFSFHGGRDAFIQVLNAYDWDFCMVQYNYFDENNQAGSTGVRAAHERGIPVIAMEPLLGGLLVSGLPDGAKQVFRDVNESRTPADWAIRWLLNQKEVLMALSGMANPAQLKENCAIADDCTPDMLSDAEMIAYKNAVAELKKTIKIPCTGCAYCMPCPKGVDIPSCFTAYNASFLFGWITGLAQYVQVTGQTTPVQTDASGCVACGKCEEHCPQSIPIAKELLKVKRRMKSFIIKPVAGLVRRIMKIK